MGAPVKTQVENELRNLFDFWGQTIDVSDQAIFILNDSGLYNEEGNKTNVSNPLTESQSRPGCVLSFVMTVHPDQADPNLSFTVTGNVRVIPAFPAYFRNFGLET